VQEEGKKLMENWLWKR